MSALNRHGSFLPLVRPRPGTSQDITVTTTSARSTAFGSDTEILRINTSNSMRYRVGDGTVVCLASDTLITAGAIEYIQLRKGADSHIAFIVSSGSEVANITECDS